MIPLEFSYFRTIFGKSGPGSCLSGLPGKCRELLSYLSIHFFGDKDLQIVNAPLQPAFIPAGKTIIWEFNQNKDQALDQSNLSNSSSNTLLNLLKLLSVNNIVKNIYLTYYAGEVEIADENIDNTKDTCVSDHLLKASNDSSDRSARDCFFGDPVPEKKHAATLQADYYTASYSVDQRGKLFSSSIMHKRVNRWLYFLCHQQYDRISPPGYIHVYQHSFTGKPLDSGIRAGPG